MAKNSVTYFMYGLCILTEGGTDKTTPVKTFQTKDPLTKTPGQKPLRTIEREFVQEAFVRVFVLGLLKIGGPRCVTYFWGGVPGCVTKCGRGRGLKLTKNNVTYFMDGPKPFRGDGYE